jgi:hypothetical protein
MINEYVIKLIDNLPDDLKNSKSPLRLDLVLDGGAFNGSYLIGALYFLKEMEKRNYIIVERISGCSIGSVIGFLYFIDALDTMPSFYDVVKKEFKEKYKLPKIKDLKTHIKDRIPDNVCEKVNGKLYICYNNIKKGIKSVKSQYNDIDEIMNTIIKSSYIPYLIDGEMLYEKKYVDGVNPYFFNMEHGKKILYLDLYGYDKIGNLLNVKNEKTNFHRILSGLLDIHNFYIKQTSTQMCSYVNDWSITNKFINNFKILLEKLIMNFIHLLIYFKNIIPFGCDFENTLMYKIISKITHDIFIILLETYCL